MVTDDTQTLSATLQISITRAMWLLTFVHPSIVNVHNAVIHQCRCCYMCTCHFLCLNTTFAEIAANGCSFLS
jgi:hypothetical protein